MLVGGIEERTEVHHFILTKIDQNGIQLTGQVVEGALSALWAYPLWLQKRRAACDV
jgi:hypothetical protein